MDEESTSTTTNSKEEGEKMVTETPPQTQEVEATNTDTEPEKIVQVRHPDTRPVVKLSVKLIETYKNINKIYYEAKAKKLRDKQAGGARTGVYNDGYDDQNYDYLIHGDEIFAERYILKHRIGKGSFGQVVCAYDRQQQTDVAIKIIKSKHAFAVQARTEIKLLELTLEKDFNDEHNVVRLLDTFVYRKHQCLVFEMLSYNLYELLKNTKFRGVSLALVRKFAKQILRGLEFLSRKDVDIIHCDLKPENILLRHPKRSAIKIIDFGSSCLSTKKMYTYIQSRFYRSPEVLLGLPYSQKIDMWSLGCVLVEMHTGEPLFGGIDQLDQLNRIVNIMGMVPSEMVAKSPEETRKIFFEKVEDPDAVPADRKKYMVTITDKDDEEVTLVMKPPKNSDSNSRRAQIGKSLEDIIGVTTGGPQGRRKGESGHSEDIYQLFANFVRSMLIYQPSERVSAKDALSDPYLSINIEYPAVQNSQSNSSNASTEKASDQKSEQPSQHAVKGSIPSSDKSGDTAHLGLLHRRSRSAPRLTCTEAFTSSCSAIVQKEGDIADDSKQAKKLDTSPSGNVEENQMQTTSALSKDQSDEGPMETSEVDDDVVGNQGGDVTSSSKSVVSTTELAV